MKPPQERTAEENENRRPPRVSHAERPTQSLGGNESQKEPGCPGEKGEDDHPVAPKSNEIADRVDDQRHDARHTARGAVAAVVMKRMAGRHLAGVLEKDESVVERQREAAARAEKHGDRKGRRRDEGHGQPYQAERPKGVHGAGV
jgi:hypothetical protein